MAHNRNQYYISHEDADGEQFENCVSFPGTVDEAAAAIRRVLARYADTYEVVTIEDVYRIPTEIWDDAGLRWGGYDIFLYDVDFTPDPQNR